MDTVRQSLRPKHQVLTLKCYPKFLQKNNAEVKANSSELSYLLYYASTRRSKLQKVGDFLEKRTVAQVGKHHIGHVQVTLQIITALIEKCSSDLSLFAGNVLQILRTILGSSDITMIEATLPTFKSFCSHQDPATLAADQNYIKQYEEVVRQYAVFASKDVSPGNERSSNWPVTIRYRKAGLQAIQSVASSESLSSETGRQLAVVIPAILVNIFSETGGYLHQLERREKEMEEHEKENDFRRRQSQSTVRTAETVEADAKAAEGTTEDADKLAEEEVGVIALKSLRSLFMAVSRGQLRPATSAVTYFIVERTNPYEHEDSWATTLLMMICGWTPVQDRYNILIATMETLIRTPMKEDHINQQLVLTSVVRDLLRSKINFIGLSVMDVLIGLLKHILQLLHLHGAEEGASPSNPQIRLLKQLQSCVGGLATHVYYTDQISDMLLAILGRLKPSKFSSIASAGTSEEPQSAADSTAPSERIVADNSFSFDSARLIALAAVQDILEVANSQAKAGSSANRGRVEIFVWEGTQWLLRSANGLVRRAYVSALLTWLKLEHGKSDLRATDEPIVPNKKDAAKASSIARKSALGSAHADRHHRATRSSYLQLLHLAIYENALQFAESEPDILLLHLLLATLTEKLGINSVKTGLPMVWRLQEDLLILDSATAKVHIGSLVHGYLWALSVHFDFETSTVGRAIHSEISRRNKRGHWVKGITVPPLPIERINLLESVGSSNASTYMSMQEPFQSFDDRHGLVERIEQGYSDALQSPPSSPPTSPGRSLSSSTTYTIIPTPREELSLKVKEQLMADWSRESCLADCSHEGSIAASVNGSRTAGNGPASTNLLTVAVPNGNLFDATGGHSPRLHANIHRSRPPSSVYGLVGPSGGSPLTASSARSAVRVDDLKRVLSGASRPQTRERQDAHHSDDTGSDSMVSADFPASEFSFSPVDGENHPDPARNQSIGSTTLPVRQTSKRGRETVPPVPPLPASLRGATAFAAPTETATSSPEGRPRTAAAVHGADRHVRQPHKPDFSSLLDEIDVGEDHGLAKDGGKPPY